MAHSPSIGVPLEALGYFAFHYAASNVAARFAKPRYLVNGIYLPLETSEMDLRIIVGGLGAEACKYGVNVVAGQTATYVGLEIPLVTVTCMGEPVRTPENPIPGDRVLLVGEVGGEATIPTTINLLLFNSFFRLRTFAMSSNSRTIGVWNTTRVTNRNFRTYDTFVL